MGEGQQPLAGGDLACYFPLAAQFRTQDEPAYCGLSTLVMCLNALQVDPLRTWHESVWRWYSEDMLECCEPLAVIKEQGIPMGKFTCLARCNGVEIVDMHHADEPGAGGVDAFRAAVRAAAGPHVVACPMCDSPLPRLGGAW